MKQSVILKQTIISATLLLILTNFSVSSHAGGGICARVKIEIRQEMTLERQAFEANMRINNGFGDITLDGVSVDVSFSDEDGNSVIASSDPNDTQALFFIRTDSMENIEAVDGTGTVHPESSADIRWLIIPAPGASNGLEQGTLYYVGATLTYFINGEEHTTQVSPDYIFVKPMPNITLDYFLPTDVYGDDAFTNEIEPIVPFPLGVRVTNNGSGTAKNLKIESAQPEIVENEQGLLIGFEIEGSEVNGEPATPSLLADFGDIAPNTCGTGHWIMTCSLSGKFVEFTADISHSDELGGELTSLIDGTPRTHFLVKDVLADLPGRDSVKDFLAQYGQGYKVYESDNVDTEVTDQSASSTLTGAGDTYTLSTPVNFGFMYVKLSDPNRGRKIIREVTRSDGKIIRSENAWLSKTRDENNNWLYFISLFDADTTDSYAIIFDDPSAGPQPPVLQFIPDRTRDEKQQLGFIVEASDPNGTVPVFSAAPLPVGAEFTDKGDGSATFDWTPVMGQAGTYPVTFTASDGELKATRSAVITITGSDSDSDGMPDYWEMKYFSNLDQDGTGDFDGNGISDLDEYLSGGDPSGTPGDINQDKYIDVSDAVLALRIISGVSPVSDAHQSSADVNGDGEIGMDEVIYVLQVVSGFYNEPVPVEVGGNISENTTWSADIIKVTGDITVDDDITLTVSPGTYIEFQGHYKLNVRGTLIAEGTPEERITFTAKDPSEGWHGIRFDNNDRTMDDNDPSELIYCNLRYGNATDGNDETDVHDDRGGAIFARNFSGLLVSNCIISNNRAAYTGGGICCFYSSPVLTDNVIANNSASDYGGGMYCFHSSPTLTNNTVANNSASVYGGGICC
ncbi:MAG: hypothetical protein DRI57_17815, partial [Deltaproteobacteria bacterium]